MKAMVLAAGLGTRMRPLTNTMPKPLIPVAGTAMIDRILDWLGASGIDEAVVNSHYLHEQLHAHVAGRVHPRVLLSHEETVLETGGGIKKALPLLGAAPFISTNGDAICIDGAQPAIHRLRDHWTDTIDALLLVHPVASAIGYEGAGDFFLDGGKLVRRRAQTSAPFVFTGVQMLHPRLFANAQEGPFSLNMLYNRSMKEDGSLPNIAALVHDGHWLHIGDPAGLRAAEAFLNK